MYEIVYTNRMKKMSAARKSEAKTSPSLSRHCSYCKEALTCRSSIEIMHLVEI